MLTGKKFTVLANVETVQDNSNGDRVKAVTSARKLASTVELVGIQTAQVGQSQGFNLAYSIEVSRAHYKKEKFLYFDKQLYEIKTTSKAKLKTKMLLNVEQSNDIEALTAIESYLSAENSNDDEDGGDNDL